MSFAGSPSAVSFVTSATAFLGHTGGLAWCLARVTCSPSISRKRARPRTTPPHGLIACVESAHPIPSPLPQSSEEPAHLANQANAFDASSVKSSFWDWEGHGKVRYLYCANENHSDIRSSSDHLPIVLFIPGFGICAADYLDNLPALANAGYRVFAMDKLGLGESAPVSRDVAQRVTLRLWRDQIIQFIEQVLGGGPVFIAGNSLGGLLVASVSSLRRDLVRGAVLLSPAPFWVMVPPTTPAFIRAGWRFLLRTFWKRLTNADILRKTLMFVYARPENIPHRTIENILRPTRNEFARDVFETVLTSPGLEYGFEESIVRAFADGQIPLALIYGRQDPWVVPMFGLRIKALVQACAYYELSPCGHCAHAEVPQVVNRVMCDWLAAVTRGEKPSLWDTQPDPFMIEDVSVLPRDHQPRSPLERLAFGRNYAVVFLAAYLSTFIES